MRMRIGIDMDNTLCVGKHWDTAEDCLKAEPIIKMIDKVRELYINDFIVIYTARQDWLMSATFEWLHKHNVPFHAVANGKVPLDKLYDDTAINLEA